jgi:hypothetical protein
MTGAIVDVADRLFVPSADHSTYRRPLRVPRNQLFWPTLANFPISSTVPVLPVVAGGSQLVRVTSMRASRSPARSRLAWSTVSA